jgi:hypothetical protein
MAFSDRLRNILEQGVAASKDIALRAGTKAQDLGERGMLTLEIKQFELQAHKLASRLGAEVYRILVETDETILSADNPALKPLLEELSLVKGSIEKREQELSERRK